MFKKVLSIFLATFMLLSCTPIISLATETSGSCGKNATWSYNTNTGILTISGTGEIYTYDSSDKFPWSSYRNNIVSVIIEKGVTSISDCAFYEYPVLTIVIVPDGLKSIGHKAFANCLNLTSIIIPNSVTNIGYDAFVNTSYYNNETNWENDVLYIENYLIKAKASLSSDFAIKNSTKTIADNAFANCSNIESITIPYSVTTIGNNAFSNCTNLESVTIPESIKSIGNGAFSNCTSLIEITIPTKITNIGEATFFNCSNLTTIIFKNKNIQIYDNEYTIPQKTTVCAPYSVDTQNNSLSVYCYAEKYGNNFIKLDTSGNKTISIIEATDKDIMDKNKINSKLITFYITIGIFGFVVFVNTKKRI